MTLSDRAVSAQAPWLPSPLVTDGMPSRRYLPQPLTDADTHRGGVVGFVAVGRGPIGGIAVSADGHRLLVTNYSDDTVTVIDTAIGDVVRTVFDTDEPFAIATPAPGAGHRSGLAYLSAASAAFDSIVAIDADTAEVVSTHAVDSSVADLVVDPAGQRVYAACTGPAGVDVVVVDPEQGVVRTADVCAGLGTTAIRLAFSPDGRRLYAAVHRPNGDAVVVLDAGLNITGTVEAGSTIRDIAVSPDGETLLIAGFDPAHPERSGLIELADTRAKRVTRTFTVGTEVTQLVTSRDGDRIYLLTADAVVVMNARTHRVADTIAVAGGPSCVVESPDGCRLYAAGHDGAVTVVAVASRGVSVPDVFISDDAVAALLELEPAV